MHNCIGSPGTVFAFEFQLAPHPNQWIHLPWCHRSNPSPVASVPIFLDHMWTLGLEKEEG